MAEYIHEEFDIPESFIALTSHEGGGMSLMNRDNEYVFDVTFDQIEDMLKGSVDPLSKSFGGYLEWRRKQFKSND